MDMQVEQLEGDVTKVVLNGRMDIDGANAVDLRFSVIAGAKKPVIVDISGVEFLASMGLRTLMVTAKSLGSGGAKMALYEPTPNVAKVLEMSGVDTIIPVAANEADAIKAVTS